MVLESTLGAHEITIRERTKNDLPRYDVIIQDINFRLHSVYAEKTPNHYILNRETHLGIPSSFDAVEQTHETAKELATSKLYEEAKRTAESEAKSRKLPFRGIPFVQSSAT
ncbi:MAG: hypothetical protein Q7S74_06825 [Nanoarchaeota archaeon]|nr:hypothetical protein [Nanoarchaeota archaeon]